MSTDSRTSAACILAVDLGTQSLRVSALSSSGERLWSQAAAVDSSVEGERFEQSPQQWAVLLEHALLAASAAGIKPDVIAAAGPLAGFVALDRNGQALTEAIMYSDRRSAPDVTVVEQAIAADVSVAVGDRLRAYVPDPLPQWLRLRREQPMVAAQTLHFLDATGWLNWSLTGQATLNPYTALRLQSAQVRQSLEIDAAVFGRVTQLGERIGSLKPAWCERLGWDAVPVVAATFDSKCAYVASGIAQPGEATDISGTVTSFGVVSAQRISDPLQRIYSVPFGEHNDRWLVRGSTASSGGVLEWARQQLLQTDFATIDQGVLATPPGSNGVLFLPYLTGERAPLWNAHARGALLGLGIDTSRAVMGRAVYEGLAFGLRHIVSVMAECGVKPSTVRLAGGLARNDVLTQIKADVLGVPLVRLADYELTTLGLAVIASVAIGARPDYVSASQTFVALDRRFEPSPEAHQRYQAYFDRYLKHVNALLPTFVPAGTSAASA